MKKFLIPFMLLFSLVVSPFTSNSVYAYETQFDTQSRMHISEIFSLLEKNAPASEETKLDLISAYFKGVPYVADRLVGKLDVNEQLVLALNELDCFTYVDYIEAFKRSTNLDEFISQLKKVRYINGEVTYLKRKHFFSDWFAENEVLVIDVLTDPAYANVVKSEVVDINKGAKGEFIKGLPDRQRTIHFIPREKITPELLKTFKTGDYVGLRTNIAGLDVTHCGIIIQKEDGTYMRHASSQKAYRQVIDQKLEDYFAAFSRPTGILVFRSNAKFAVKPMVRLSNDNTGIVVAGKLSTTMRLSTEKLNESVEALKNESYDLFDITVTGATTPLTGQFTINVPYTKNVKTVYHITDNGELEKFDFEQNAAFVVFTTTHFSKFAIVYASETEQPKKDESSTRQPEMTTQSSNETSSVQLEESKMSSSTKEKSVQKENKMSSMAKQMKKELPKTGDASHLFIVGGSLLILLSVALYTYKKRS